MSKYAELDKLILDKIDNDTPTPFCEIHFYERGSSDFNSNVFTMCEGFATKTGEGFRVLDRRLQALRKAGKIKSVPGKGWIKLNGEVK